jgi:hypothetical protein
MAYFKKKIGVNDFSFSWILKKIIKKLLKREKKRSKDFKFAHEVPHNFPYKILSNTFNEYFGIIVYMFFKNIFYLKIY